MKKFLMVLISWCLAVSLSACGTLSPQKTVENYMEALKTLDFTTANTYLSNNDEVEEILPEEEEFCKLMVKNLDYKIISETISEDKTSAVVKLDVTNTNFENFVTEYLKAAISEVITGGLSNAGNEDLNVELLKSTFEKCESSKVTNTVELKLIKNENGWKIETNDEFVDAVFGGVSKAMGLFNKTSNQ